MELFGNVWLPMGYWGWQVIGALVSVLVIVLVVRIIIRAAHGDWHTRWERRHGWCCEPDDGREARRILDERYAKGEMSDEEYRQKRENMKS